MLRAARVLLVLCGTFHEAGLCPLWWAQNWHRGQDLGCLHQWLQVWKITHEFSSKELAEVLMFSLL